MDALVALQYRYLLAVLAGAVVVGIIAARLYRRPDVAEAEPPAGEGVPEPMLAILVALALVTVVLLVLPALMILRYFPHWRVAALAIAALLMVLPPLAYAWRARST